MMPDSTKYYRRQRGIPMDAPHRAKQGYKSGKKKGLASGTPALCLIKPGRDRSERCVLCDYTYKRKCLDWAIAQGWHGFYIVKKNEPISEESQ